MPGCIRSPDRIEPHSTPWASGSPASTPAIARSPVCASSRRAPAPPENSGSSPRGQREVLVGTGTHAPGERHRRQADAQPVPAGDPADDDPHQHQLIGGRHRGQRRQRDLELVGAVLGMELFDRHAGRRPRRRSRRGRSPRARARRPGRTAPTGRRAAARRRARRARTRSRDRPAPRSPAVGQRCLDPAQRAAAAGRDRGAVLVEERAGRPRQSVADNAQGASGRCGSAGRRRRRWPAVNAMPVWSMAKTCHTGLAPSPGSANALSARSGTVLAWVSPAGLTTVPMRATTPRPRVGRWPRRREVWQPFCHRAGTEPLRQGLQRELAALADVQRAQHATHADPHRARQRQVGRAVPRRMLTAARPRSPRRRAARCGRWRSGRRTRRRRAPASLYPGQVRHSAAWS